MNLSLDQILQDAEEYAKIRDAATPGPWRSQVQESCRDWYEILSKDSPGMDIARVAPWSGHVEANATFIAAAKNYDFVSVIKQLVEIIKELEEQVKQ